VVGNLKLAQSTVSNDVAATGFAGDILPIPFVFSVMIEYQAHNLRTT
jgi:hypothetical protein